MIYKTWGVLSVLCLGLLCACSNDEPVNTTRQEDNKMPTVTTKLTARELSGLWQGFRYVVTGDTYANGTVKGEHLYIRFKNETEGTMTHEGVEGNVSYTFKYSIVDNKVECVCQSDAAPDEDTFVLNLEYNGEYLSVTNTGLNTFVVAKNHYACTDRYGNVIKDNDKYLHRIWVHENGKNILDLKNLWNIQLKEAGTKKYNFVNKPDKPIWDYEYAYDNVLIIGSFEYVSKPDHYKYDAVFSVIELTENKLVLSSTTIDTYYPGDESDVPQITDVMEVLTFPTKWKCESRSLIFNEDNTCQLSLDNAYRASGTYKI